MALQLQSACSLLKAPKIRVSNHRRLFPYQNVSANPVECRYRRDQLRNSCLMLVSKSLSRGAIVCASDSNSNSKLKSSGKENTSVSVNGIGGVDVEPFRGKSGSISFHGLTHQLVEEGKLVSAPFKEGTGSFLWVLAPAAIILSLVLPQFILGNGFDAFSDEVVAELVASLTSEAIFYIGLATFLLVTDKVQKPYLQFSSKRWGLITGLKGYLFSAFFTMGFKVFAPLFAVYVIFPVLGLPAVVAVAPFLVGCVVQFAFEKILEKRRSSCWPLVPIIFEVYRLYQLTKAAQYMETLMLSMKGAPVTPELLERSSALGAMVVTFQVVALVCLWSLMAFLLRLFPSRPVAENY